jgi:hypothetical protein
VGTAGDNESETKMLTPYNSTEFGVPQAGTTPPKYAWLGAAGISTETSLGSGVATQSGASYVPQVARALQTAPVVPPGAFPNGSSGTQFTAAPVAAGAIAGAQEIATQFWQKAEAERQKAREEEAAAVLRRCQEEGGCGAKSSGEEEDDPCETVTDSYSAEMLGVVVLDVSAKIKYCWTAQRVESAYGAGKSELAINHWYLPLTFKFLRWEEAAFWEGEDYIVERTAIFWGQLVFCGISKDGSGPPICPGKGYRLNLTFVLGPDGKHSTGHTFVNED